MRQGGVKKVDKQKQVTICLPVRLVEAIDAAAEAENLSRSACMEHAIAWYLVSIRRREVFSRMRQGYREMAGLNLTLAEECLPLESECDCMETSCEILSWIRRVE